MIERDHLSAPTRDAGDLEVVEIQREIARTQGEMGGTLEAIQEKLNPSALIEQARGPVEETTDHIVAEVQRAVRESAEHLIEQARGPIEDVSDHLITRATGAIEEATDRLVARATIAVQETTDHVLDRARVTATEAVAEVMEHTGTALRAATLGKVEKMVSTISETTRGVAYDANETTKGLGATVLTTIQTNPLPAALAAVGLGWLYLKRPRVTAGTTTTLAYHAGGQSGQRVGVGYEAGGATIGANAGQLATGVRDTVAGAAGSVASAVGATAGGVADTVGSAAGTVADTAGSAAGAVADTVAGAAGAVVGTVGSAAGAVGSTVGAVGGAVGHAADGTQLAARDLAAEVWYQTQRVGDGFQTLAQRNPLALGAAGIAVGALIGLAVPTTPQESQVMGAARDTLLDKAMGATQDTVEKVADIAQKAESAAESVIKTEAPAPLR